jgi:CRISPR/Cas system CMR-associated protein Cmr5 small subunit
METLEAKTSKLAYGVILEILNIQDKNRRKKLLNLIDKALGVLSNNGVYAYYVIIISQKDKKESNEKGAKEIFLDSLKELFEIVQNEKPYDSSNRQEYFESISKDIHKLLFLKQLLEKTLIYARYHAKALEDSDE